MLKVKLTENYCGVTISGDYNDLDHLYDSINFIVYKEDNILLILISLIFCIGGTFLIYKKIKEIKMK